MSQLNVYQSYEKISEWFDEHRDRSLMEQKYLELMIKNIPKDGKILDLGCGMGQPIAQFFIERGYDLTGIDGSKKMIALCQLRFPQAQWVVGDMRHVSFKKTFDLALAWHSFFHLSQEDQREMLPKFAAHLNPGGLLAFTSGIEQGEVWSDNGGEQLYHASLSTAEYQLLLQQNHFEVIVHQVEDPECGEATIWIARKQI